jgi:ADP-heptose:LPS heptosyltransferase
MDCLACINALRPIILMITRLPITLLRWNASLRRRRDIAPESISSILIVELTRLGDVIVMVSALKWLRMNFPQATIRVLVDQRYADLVGLLVPGVEVQGVERSASLRYLLKAIQSIRSVPVSLAISASPARKNAITALASRAERIMGYLSHRSSFTPFLEMTPVDAFGFTAHPTEYHARENIYARINRILETLGCAGDGDLRLKTVDWENRSGRGFNDAKSFPPLSERFVIIFPQAGWKYREWGLENYLTLAKRIVTETDSAVVVAFPESPDEEIVGRDERIHPVWKLRLTDIAALMRHAVLVLANDSGPVHLAAALGVPTVALYGPAAPELTGPAAPASTCLFKHVECSPCDQRRCIRPENPCMQLHTVGEVLEAVKAHLRAAVKYA